MAHHIKYTFSFTGASALIAETLVIAEEFARVMDWEAVHESVMKGNLLNKVKEATFKREFREIKKRLSHLSNEQIGVLISGDLDDAKAMILLSLVKTYPYFRDFIVDVLRNKYLLFDSALTEVDYTKFFNAKCLSHIELTHITESTAKKIKQRTFTLLAQTGLISQVNNGIIIKPILSSRPLEVILNDDPALLNAFLFSNEEIKTLLKQLKHAQRSNV